MKRLEQLEALAALFEQTSPTELDIWQGLLARRGALLESLQQDPIPSASVDRSTIARLAVIDQRGRLYAGSLESARAALKSQLRDLYRDGVLVRAYLAAD